MQAAERSPLFRLRFDVLERPVNFADDDRLTVGGRQQGGHRLRNAHCLLLTAYCFGDDQYGK
jgi:hypothetical protein